MLRLVSLFASAFVTIAVVAQERDRLAVADFEISGDVGIPDAGKSVSALLLAKFDRKYQLVERAQLTAILKEHDLTIADIVANPAVVRSKRLQGVRFLVLGTITKLGTLAISARLVDVQTGDIVQTAEIAAKDANGLQDALGELTRILQMSADEKKVYLVKRGSNSASQGDGFLAIQVDDTHLWDLVGDRDFFVQRDVRFRGGGGVAYFTIQIWPADCLARHIKEFSESEKKCKASGLPTPIVLSPPAHGPPKSMSADDTAAWVRDVTATLSKGEMIEIPVHPLYASANKPLRLKVPSGKYYFNYKIYLNKPAQSGSNSLTVGNLLARDVGWGPLSVRVSSDADSDLKVCPYLTNTVVDNGWQDYFRFLTESGTAP